MLCLALAEERCAEHFVTIEACPRQVEWFFYLSNRFVQTWLCTGMHVRCRMDRSPLPTLHPANTNSSLGKLCHQAQREAPSSWRTTRTGVAQFPSALVHGFSVSLLN